MGLHQSDSGADLSEYHDQHEAKSIQNLLASYGKTFQATETEITSDCTETSHPSTKKDRCCTDDSMSFTLGDKELMVQSYSDNTIISNKEANSEDLISFTQYDSDSHTYPYSAYYGSNKSAMNMEWEQFWAKNGEQLIWSSWIEKYADYINPNYFQNNICTVENEKSQNTEINEIVIEKCYEQNIGFPNQAHKNCELIRSNFVGIFSKSNSSGSQLKSAVFSSNSSFSFDQSSRQESNDNDIDSNRKINIEISQNDDNDGWNPLSPLSAEESYNQHSNAEDERLLMRCDSINGSTAKTNATSDSMTNVTKMTLTSSSCDSINFTNSSSLGSSFESSSMESNTTNSGSDQENELPTEDDKYWQQLWKEHFQLQYQQQYELFIMNYKKKHIDYNQMYSELNECTSENVIKDTESDQSDEQDVIQVDNKTTAQSTIKPPKNVNIHKSERIMKPNKCNTKRLIMDSVGMLIKNLSMKSEHDEPADADDKNTQESKQQTQVQISTVTPVESARVVSSNNIDSNNYQQKSLGEGDGDKPHENRPITLKRRYVCLL